MVGVYRKLNKELSGNNLLICLASFPMSIICLTPIDSDYMHQHSDVCLLTDILLPAITCN